MARRFQFRLETVRKLKEQALDRQRRVVADTVRALGRVEQRIARLTRQLYRTIEQSRSAQQAAKLDVNSLCGQEFHRGWLHRKIMESHTELATTRAELHVERAKLAEAWKQLRAIERLREKQWTRYRTELAREEQAANDEAALNLHLRKRDHRRDEVTV